MANGNTSAATDVLMALKQTGSTWISAAELETYCVRHHLSFERIISSRQIVEHDGYYSPRFVAEDETKIAINIMSLLYCSYIKITNDYTIEKLVHRFEEERNEGRKLHRHQVDAVKMVVNHSFSVLTGGPGTGKTTVLSAITFVLRELERDCTISYTAPTGKAARRITESTGEQAGTLHSKLNLKQDEETQNPEEQKEIDKIQESVLFIDESSMNDNYLSARLSEAMKDGMRVVFVGDVDQLASVGIGAVLRDLIASDVIPVTQLTYTFRQDNSSILYENICKCRQGDADFMEGEDFKTVIIPEIADADELAVKAIMEAYKQEAAVYGKENVIVLLPYRRTGVCSNILNKYIQHVANKETAGYRHTCEADKNTFFFKKGDFVMHLKNTSKVVNGDVGEITDVSADGVVVSYVDAEVKYSPSELDQLALAYAMSIHKSQGSEYSSVIMCLMNSHKTMLQRNLVYTGITRAKKKCTFIYQQKALEKALATIADKNRKTFLKEKLQALDKKYRLACGMKL